VPHRTARPLGQKAGRNPHRDLPCSTASSSAPVFCLCRAVPQAEPSFPHDRPATKHRDRGAPPAEGGCRWVGTLKNRYGRQHVTEDKTTWGECRQRGVFMSIFGILQPMAVSTHGYVNGWKRQIWRVYITQYFNIFQLSATRDQIVSRLWLNLGETARFGKIGATVHAAGTDRPPWRNCGDNAGRARCALTCQGNNPQSRAAIVQIWETIWRVSRARRATGRPDARTVERPVHSSAARHAALAGCAWPRASDPPGQGLRQGSA
jgi:hypothetical protein